MTLTYRGVDDQGRERYGDNQNRTPEQLIATAHGGNWQYMMVLDGGEEVAVYKKQKNGKIRYWIKEK